MLVYTRKEVIKNTFDVLKYLYQQNNADIEEEEKKFEDDCYNSEEYNYLLI